MEDSVGVVDVFTACLCGCRGLLSCVLECWKRWVERLVFLFSWILRLRFFVEGNGVGLSLLAAD